MALRHLVAGLAVAARLVSAQCSGTTTISTQAQATGLSSCTTFKGDIWIGDKTSEDISLDGIGHITGGLYGKNVNKDFTSLSGSDLNAIDKIFGLNNITGLGTMSFPSLTQVGAIEWDGLPVLNQLSFDQEVSKANILAIQNTGLGSLNGINLMEVQELYLANNRFLTEVSMKLGNISSSLTMAANGLNTKVDFPNLEWAYNVTFRNVSSLSLPKLAFVNQSMGFISNFMNTIDIPDLTLVGGSLAFVSNGHLSDISAPKLKGIGGGLQIANNTQLTKVNGFNRLTEVGGAIDMYGTFKDVSFPSINLVQGAFNLQSTNNIKSSCAKFQKLSGPNLQIQGKFTCYGDLSNPAGQGTQPQGTGEGSGSSAGTSLLIPYATGIIGVVAAIFGML